ncbi:MAG: 1,4-alpha-glucan branching protein GlgB [Thiotrichaceae bacterium]|nr:1,4-alpha-glucan branching protein GlgB [Thiotrichaceae bacterium]
MDSSKESRRQQALAPLAHKILQARHHNPFVYLGRHIRQHNGQQETVIRTILPHAVSASLVAPQLAFKRLGDNVIFELTSSDTTIPEHYVIEWLGSDGSAHQHYDAYRFQEQIAEAELALFINGKLLNASDILGAHFTTIDHIDGVLFATWAPNAERVSVVGPFNHWDNRCHAMRARGASGIWEIFIPGLTANDQYQFEIRNHHNGIAQLKTDPYAQQLAADNDKNALVTSQNEYQWQDQQWMARRTTDDWQHKPLSIYEVDLASWRRDHDHASLNYQALAEQLVTYVRDLGFTHIQLFSESLIRPGCGFFAPDSRHGTPDDFRYFIDYCHQHRVGVIFNWHIDHLPTTPDSLYRYDGERLYEQASHNPGVFDYSKNGSRNFLISSALFWLNDFHLDGLKLRTSTSMIYQKGQQNNDALSLLREINLLAQQHHPGVLMLAEENTVWPMVTTPTALGGLGFSIKWNIGWHHDTLRYLTHDTSTRQAHHDTLTFSQNYAFSEHFMLPFSPQNNAQNKAPLLDQMPGNKSQRFANLRLLYSYMFTHPGKKLLFMGNEFASNIEWRPEGELPWALTDDALHGGLSLMVCKLNALYRNIQALHYYDFNEQGFEWIERHDSSQSLIVFRRNGEECHLIVALNFSAITRNGYRIGIEKNQHYREIFNSDARAFGGEDRFNLKRIPADDIPWMKQPFSLSITLPPLSAVIIKPLQESVTIPRLAH